MKMKADWSDLVFLAGAIFLLLALNVLAHNLSQEEPKTSPPIELQQEEEEGRVVRV